LRTDATGILLSCFALIGMLLRVPVPSEAAFVLCFTVGPARETALKRFRHRVNGPWTVRMRALATPKPSSQFVEAFCAGMPSSYWLCHEHAAIREHAAIVWRRGNALAHVEIHPAEDGSTAWICVVTDDRPGLLSLLTAAVSANDLDILSAKIYCRATGGPRDEAVDFFLVRAIERLDEPSYDEAFVGALRRSIVAFLSGQTDIHAAARQAKPTARPTCAPPADVHFDERYGDVDRLTIDTKDRPGLLLAITTALFLEKVRIAGSEVLTVAGQAHDEFDVLDWEGSRLTQQRKEIVVERVKAALAAAD
jgi:[protein-PII] uridylyltransferase